MTAYERRGRVGVRWAGSGRYVARIRPGAIVWMWAEDTPGAMWADVPDQLFDQQTEDAA